MLPVRCVPFLISIDGSSMGSPSRSPPASVGTISRNQRGTLVFFGSVSQKTLSFSFSPPVAKSGAPIDFWPSPVSLGFRPPCSSTKGIMATRSQSAGGLSIGRHWSNVASRSSASPSAQAFVFCRFAPRRRSITALPDAPVSLSWATRSASDAETRPGREI